ncbi:MAG TPA: hypothetical protein VGF59_05745 [Bryobacteraceae bacterium]|jgi:hypothetical protein|nr:hypothetical protein [Gaiellales bacterium]
MKHLLSLRRPALTSLAVAAVAMAIGGISLAHAGGHSAGQHRITLKEVQTGQAFVDISHTKNGKPGDGFIFHSRLFNRGGTQVGTLDVQCTLMLSHHAQCLGTVTLPGGTLSVTALSPTGNAPTHIAINGGTGRYAKVRGQGVSFSTGQNTSRDVLYLTY